MSKQQTRILAKDPSFLRDIIRKRKSDLTRLDADIVHILPMLKKDYLPSEPNTDFQFFPGIVGAKKVFVDACLNDVDLPEYVFNYKIADDTFGREVINMIADKENNRKRRFIPKEILPLTKWTKHCLTYQFGRDPRYLDVTNIRYIDQTGFDVTSKITIKDHRIWMVSVKGEECWGVMMKSQTYAQTLIAVFDVLWNIATPITKQIIVQWGENEDLIEEKKTKKHIK